MHTRTHARTHKDSRLLQFAFHFKSKLNNGTLNEPWIAKCNLGDVYVPSWDSDQLFTLCTVWPMPYTESSTQVDKGLR